jgi:hypothetical protein
MVGEQLQAIFKNAQAKSDKEGFSTLPEGTTATLYAAHGGVGLTVPRVDAVKVDGGIVTAKTTKKETYTFELGDLFALALEGSTGGAARRAGFG